MRTYTKIENEKTGKEETRSRKQQAQPDAGEDGVKVAQPPVKVKTVDGSEEVWNGQSEGKVLSKGALISIEAWRGKGEMDSTDSAGGNSILNVACSVLLVSAGNKGEHKARVCYKMREGGEGKDCIVDLDIVAGDDLPEALKVLLPFSGTPWGPSKSESLLYANVWTT